MNIEFENKYVVVKRDDIEKYLSNEGKKALYRCLDSLLDSRRHDGKKENTYMVINTDEPYAPQVAQIMQRYGHYTPGGPIEVAAPEPVVRNEAIRFANEHFDEIKAGTVLINIDEDDDEFTKGGEYVVYEDEEGLFVVDDGQFEQLFNEVLARYFIIKA